MRRGGGGLENAVEGVPEAGRGIEAGVDAGFAQGVAVLNGAKAQRHPARPLVCGEGHLVMGAELPACGGGVDAEGLQVVIAHGPRGVVIEELEEAADERGRWRGVSCGLQSLHGR